jgi:cytochrome c
MRALLLTLLLVGPLPAPEPSTVYPRVFRCSLDQLPRMVVLELAPGWWMAFDAQTCRIHKVWDGDILLTGTVYDTRHGPQPRAIGDVLVVGGAPAVTGASGTPRWLGYHLEPAAVMLNFAIGEARIRLQPSLTQHQNRSATLLLRWTVDELPAGASILLPLDLTEHAGLTGAVDGTSIVLPKSGTHEVRLELSR